MRVTRTDIILSCDNCGTELQEPQFYKNNGSFQDSYFKLNDIDLCFKCAGKILSVISRKEPVDDDKVKQAINYLRNGISGISGKLNTVDLSKI